MRYLIILLLFCSCQPKEFVMTGGTIDQNIIVLVTEDTSYALKHIRKFYEVEFDVLDCRGVTFPSQDGLPVIMWLPNADDKSIVNHELLHVTNDVMRWAGIELNKETEEIYSYELQYLTRQFYLKIK